MRFIGTKTVIAEAMTRAAYNDFRGWPLPADEDGDDAGYLVEYTDGGKPNVPGRAGYVSWSPKEQFDNAYLSRPAISGFAPHQQRVADERDELGERLAKLEAFIGASVFFGLGEAERRRLVAQRDAMFAYLSILCERISSFDSRQVAPVSAASERKLWTT